MFLLLKVGRILPETDWCQYQSVIVAPTAIVWYQIKTDPFWCILSEPTLGEAMSDILATKVIVSQPHERQPTATPNSRAKIHFNSNFNSMAKFQHGCSTHFFYKICIFQPNLRVIFFYGCCLDGIAHHNVKMSLFPSICLSCHIF